MPTGKAAALEQQVALMLVTVLHIFFPLSVC